MFWGSINLESLKSKPTHEILAPLRKSAYAKMKEYKVIEFICTPNLPASKWQEPIFVITDKNTPTLPEPKKLLTTNVCSICTFLYLCEGIDELYFKIIYAHVKHR